MGLLDIPLTNAGLNGICGIALLAARQEIKHGFYLTLHQSFPLSV